jgi:tellurite resistance protein TehA-like permease
LIVKLRPALAELRSHPSGGSFAFVMATGIVSIAAFLQGLDAIAVGLFALDVIAFVVLSLLMLIRLARHPTALLGELSGHESGMGFLTIVAGTGVLGNGFALLASAPRLAAGLWLAACALWVVLVYALLSLLTTSPAKPTIETGVDGTWLLIVVASEALAILGTHVAGVFARPDIVVDLALCWFLLGAASYLPIISAILRRWLFAPLAPEQLTPPYWINMGAAAITTLASARLEAIAGSFPLLTRLLPAISAATVLFWTVATWWIPLLLALTIWRHWVRGLSLRYRFDYWAMVFPLGMYTAATWTFARQNGVEFLNFIPAAFVWVAIAAWLATFLGMMRAIRRR